VKETNLETSWETEITSRKYIDCIWNVVEWCSSRKKERRKEGRKERRKKGKKEGGSEKIM
jgi:hypothetical protein